ncbi:hypothetical protein CORC01_02733 [Colletotrichum orchidophilum]|uniref:Uncharacterized protein n=1 Tax=Colletotrichum orchidophilum TaxID=1209926 RepID=A0A1G4BKJ4_9PEZI|nr:uncharacterized protein CORC01_02733 [Colletotrichum orchidophilum]OHF01855.1 hypothetical protein CORC01_02733 [Colletotrichum orchidophilum]
MSSSAPSQPPTSEAYTAASNPATRNPAENAVAHESEADRETAARDAALGRTPFPQSQSRSADDATPSSLGAGVRSSGPVDETERRNTAYVSEGSREAAGPENPNVEAEQMATLAEGKVADAVERKSGTQKVPGQEITVDDFGSGLEEKKREQQEARDAIKKARSEGVDADGGLGRGRGERITGMCKRSGELGESSIRVSVHNVIDVDSIVLELH